MDMLEFLKQQQKFQAETFGTKPRSAGVIDHIKKELKEVEVNPAEILEWIDIVLLAFGGALNVGFSPARILGALETKIDINNKRDWPNWKTANPDKAIEHIKE